MNYHGDVFMSSTVLMGNPVATTKPVVFEISIPAGRGRGAYINEFGLQFQDADEVRIGFWRGQSEDVVITDQKNEFISILKGGVNNARVKNARNK